MRLKSSSTSHGKKMFFFFLLLLNNNQKKIKLFPSLYCPFITPTSSFPTLLLKEAYKFGFSTSTISIPFPARWSFSTSVQILWRLEAGFKCFLKA